MMEPIGFVLIILCAVLGSAGVIAYWDISSKQRLQQSVRARWSQNRAVLHDPVIAYYFGSDLLDSYIKVTASTGVIGVVDDQVVFVRRGGNHETFIRLDRLRWIGTRNIRVQHGKTAIDQKALILHHEDRNRWYVSAFVIANDQDLLSLLRAIGEQTGLNPEINLGVREYFGPQRAQRMAQDIYGQWEPASTGGLAWSQSPRPSVLELGRMNGELYLAPDRLVYDGYSAIHLAQIRRVDLYEQGGLQKLNPFNEELLRIEYEQDDKHHVAGFLVRSGRAWAEALQARLNIPVEVHEGRKKK